MAATADDLLQVLRQLGIELRADGDRLTFRAPRGALLYNLGEGLVLRGRLDAGALERALGQVVARHEALRSTIVVTEDGTPAQVVGPGAAVRLERARAERLADAERLAADAMRRPFDLGRGPLLRALLVQLDPTEHLLVLVMHHVACDGWSVRLLVEELSELYAAAVERREPDLQDLPVQYADYAVWQRGRLRGEVLDGHLAYWKRALAGAPQVLDLPSDRPRPAEPGNAGTSRHYRLPRTLAADLRGLGREQGTTLFVTLLAGLAALLSRYSGQRDLLVGVSAANRDRAELEGLVGLFLDTLVLRCDLVGQHAGVRRGPLGPAGPGRRPGRAVGRRRRREAHMKTTRAYEWTLEEQMGRSRLTRRVHFSPVPSAVLDMYGSVRMVSSRFELSRGAHRW